MGSLAALPFQTQQSLARNLCLSANKQATVGEQFADAAFTRRSRFNVSGVLDRMPSFRNDKASAGKGTEFATSSSITSWDTKFTFKEDLDDWLAGFLACHAMGQDIVSGGLDGAPYLHSLVFDESFETQSPMTNFYLEDTNDLKRIVPDMALADLTITIPNKGPVTFESNWAGTGRVIPYTMVAALPVVPASTFFSAADCSFQFGANKAGDDPLSETNLTGRLISAVIKISTGAMPFHSPGDGGFAVFVRQDLRKFSIQATIAAADTDNVESALAAGQLSYMDLIMTASSSAIMEFFIPNFQMKSAKMGVQGNMTIWNIEADETTIMPTVDGTDGPVDINVTNLVPSYLTAV